MFKKLFHFILTIDMYNVIVFFPTILVYKIISPYFGITESFLLTIWQVVYITDLYSLIDTYDLIPLPWP